MLLARSAQGVIYRASSPRERWDDEAAARIFRSLVRHRAAKDLWHSSRCAPEAAGSAALTAGWDRRWTSESRVRPRPRLVWRLGRGRRPGNLASRRPRPRQAFRLARRGLIPWSG